MSGLIEKYIKELFEEKKISEKIKEKLWRFYYDKLSTGVDEGYSPKLEFYDKPLADKLKYSIAEFSAFKETSFRKDLEELMTKDGKFVPWSEFKKEAFKLSGDYNGRWLEAEYHQTVANANMAQKWKEFEQNVDLYPNVKLVSVRDARVRPEHKVLDGVIRPYNDPFWDTHLPPLDWGCRCHVEQTDEEPTEVKGGIQTKIEFENNPAKTGKVFGGSAYEKQLNEKEIGEAKENAEKWSREKDYEVLNKNELFNINKKELNKQILKDYPDIDIEKLNAINLYSSNHYSDINAFNRGIKGIVNDTYTKEYYESITRTINKGLDEIPDKYTGIAYRSTDLKPEHLDVYKKAFESGKTHTEKAFFSTSTSKDTADDFGGNVRFWIKSKTGTKIMKVSNLPGEKEVLFKAGQKFKVIDFEDYGDGTYFIEIEEI